MEKLTEASIDEYIRQQGAEIFFTNNRIYTNMIERLSMQDATHHLSKYFQVNVRYLWMKQGLIKPKNKKGDLLLFEKGPKYIMSKNPVSKQIEKKAANKSPIVQYKQNAAKYKSKISRIKSVFTAKYPFTCGICEKKKALGKGSFTQCEEFFLCYDCIKRFNISYGAENKPKIFSTPMGGSREYRMNFRHK